MDSGVALFQWILLLLDADAVLDMFKLIDVCIFYPLLGQLLTTLVLGLLLTIL